MEKKQQIEVIKRNFHAIVERIENAARAAGRDPDSVSLLPATKYAGIPTMEVLYEAGIREFGENQVKAAEEKARTLAPDAVFHLIGHLQRNKAARAVTLFKTIQSIDSERILKEVSKKAAARVVPILLEVNIAGDPDKYGFQEPDIFTALERAASCKNIVVQGFMTVPPFRRDPEEVRPFFRKLREVRDAARERGLGDGKLTILSMGMSHDFEIAVEEGATCVRVGSALFEGIEAERI